MPLLIHFFKELWEFLKVIPLWVYAVVLAVALWLYDRTNQYYTGYEHAESKYELELEEQRQFAKEEEQRLKLEFEKVKNNLIKEQNEGYAKRDKIIADWQSGRLRLKARFSPTTCPSAGSDGTTTTGFLDEDVQFLVREAARADGVVRQLQACQGVIREYTKTSE